MTDSEKLRTQLSPYLSALEAGPLSAQMRGELEALLTEDVAAREYVARYMTTVALIEWEFSPCELPVEVGDESETFVEQTRTQPSKSTQRMMVLPLKVSSIAQGLDWRRHPVAFLTTVGVLTLIFSGLLLLFLSHSEEGGGRNHLYGAASGHVATITNTQDVVWAKDQEDVKLGTRLLARQRLDLEKGFLRLLFRDGAWVVVEGPAKLRVDSFGSMTLDKGRLLARVSKQAQGFSVETPTVEVVDLGTEFGVDVRKTETEVQVFEGKVQARCLGGVKGQDRTLVAGEATLFGNSPQQVFYVKEKKMNRAIYLSLATVLALPISQDADGAVIPYDQVVQALNPIGYWRQEGNGFDSSGNGHTGTLNGTSSFASGPTLPGITGNMAGNFGAGFTHVSVADDNDFSFGAGTAGSDTPFSISVWVNPDQVNDGNRGIFSKDNGTQREWTLFMLADNSLRFFIKNQGGAAVQKSQDTVFVAPIDSWTNVVVTYDGSESEAGIKFWINGSSAALTNPFSEIPFVAMSNTSAEVRIGNFSGSFFDGQLDEAAIFDGVLTASQISALSGQPQLVPEPTTGATLGIGGMMVIGFARRRKRAIGKK